MYVNLIKGGCAVRNDIHIVLDSIAVAEETPLRDDPRCHVVPLLVRHGDTEWVDGEKSLQEMFAMVEASGQLPKTSQPAIGRFLDVFTELAADGKKVIAIMLDGVLSGTVQTARLAARQVMSEIPGSDIRVFDSLTAACPISGMAMEVLAYAETGATMDELEEYLKGLIERTETYFSVNTLDYLQKGGRIGAVGALVGNILVIRPIVHIDTAGELVVVDKCRTRKKVLQRMVELAAANAPIEAVYVANAEAEEDAETLRKAMLELFPGLPVLVTGIGTVLAAHLGPGVIGLFVRRQR